MAAIDDHGGFKAVLAALTDGRNLTRSEAHAAVATVLAGEATDAQLAALITALRMKGESVDEIGGMVDAMLGAATPVDLPAHVIDIVGTGGTPFRRAHALNVSTMASFVAAAAGATVCKHGNIGASSTSGSFDFLMALGVAHDLGPAPLAECVSKTGVGFCFARAYHPAMRHAGPVRAELGISTVFNILGPLSHPGRVTRMVLGVGDPSLGPKVAQVLAARPVDHAVVVHGAGGLDEFSTTGVNRVWNVEGDRVDERSVDPLDYGLAPADLADIAGGDARRNVEIAHAVFAGERGPHRDIVALNAAAALVAAAVSGDIADGLDRAAAALDSGAARAKLDEVVETSRALAG